MRKKIKKEFEESQEEAKEEKKIKEPEEDFYVLGIGETLNDVAEKFNVDIKKLEELNGDIIGGNQIRLK